MTDAADREADVMDGGKAVEVICPECLRHLGGAVAGNAVRWTICDDCEEES